MKHRNSLFTWRALVVAMALLLLTTGAALAQDAPTPDPVVPAQGNAIGNGQGAGQGAGQGSQFMDADGDGQCDNFVDADGNGVCDNAGAMMRGQGQGNMQGRGGMRGMHAMMHSGRGMMQGMMQGQHGMQGQGLNQGNGPRFADADGDGVCDHMQGDATTDK